jgi:hypothetical protein
MENNNGIAIIKAICHGFVERAEALNLKGKKRDDAAMDYFVGANRALVAMGHAEEASAIGTWTAFVLAHQGYRAITEEVSAA